ncbi:MAG: hypothetical protein EBS05_19690, partial [Proteobacteria bacterium]|nr:hypothetical protein [Pseudomonadota bacterium]
MGAWKPVAAKPKQDEGHSVLGFLGNIAGEVKDTALGLVETGYQGIKSTGQGLYGGTIGWIPGTGGDTAREAFVNNFNNNLDAVWSTLKQSGSNWKSVVTGDFEPLYKHPLSMALDVASIASGGAGAVAKGAQVARAAEVARAAKILDSADLVEAARGIKLGNGAKKGKAIKRESPYPVGKGQSATGKFKPGEARNAPARPAWLQGALDQIPGGAEKGAQLAKSNARVAKLSKIADSRSLAARVRPNRVLKTTPIELEKLQSLELDTAKLSDSLTVPSHGAGSASLPRRPLARGPVGRQIQKGGIKAYELLLDKSPRLNSLSERNFSRRLVEHGDRIAKERAAQVQVNAGRLQFDEAVRKLGRDPMLKAAATLHLEGVLTERGGLTASELRDRAVARAEEGLAAERRAHPNADPKSYEQNVRHIELLKSMPDELLKLEGDSKHVARVRQVVDTGRNFDRNMSKHDPFRLDESGVRDVRGERATISQRVLTGNAEKIDLGESRSRVMVRSQWERMRRSGKVFASDRAIGKTFRDAATRAGLDNAPGVAARDWIVNETHVLRDHKGEITPEQEIHLLEGVERGEIRDKRGRTALPGVRADAGHAIKRIKQQERNSQPLVTAYRVRGADGGATHWVREERKGEVPAAIREHGTRRKGGDVVEKVVVPANHWRARQDENGRVASLGKSLETGTVRLKDGTLVGQRGRTATVRPGARVDAARYELSAARKSEFLPRDEGYKPGGFADSVNRGTLTPGQEQQLRQQLGVNKPRNKMTNEEIVIKNLIDAGHLNIRELSASGKKLTEADVEKAIGKYTSDMFDGKLPLNADGQVNFDAMFKRLRSDKKLAEAYNDPRLLSEVETAPGVYMSHQAVGTIGGHGRASRGRQVTSTVGPEMGVRKNDGVLAGRMGYSLDPVVMMHDANNISKIIASRDFLMHAVQAWAVSDKNGRPIVMPAKDAMRLDDAQYRAVPLSQIKNAETTIREWRPGKKKEDDLPLTFVDDGGVDGAEKVVVFPRDIADKLQYAFGNPHGFWKKYDSVMQIWRSGVLALTPRWYINNLVGNTFFYGVYTGMDLTSLRIARAAAKQAKASGKGSVIPHQVHGEGMSSQGQDTVIAGLDAGASATGAGKGRFSAGYYRVTDRGYQINNVFEGAVRDAAYVHAFKKFLKDNGQSVKRRGLS